MKILKTSRLLVSNTRIVSKFRITNYAFLTVPIRNHCSSIKRRDFVFTLDKQEGRKKVRAFQSIYRTTPIHYTSEESDSSDSIFSYNSEEFYTAFSNKQEDFKPKIMLGKLASMARSLE